MRNQSLGAETNTDVLQVDVLTGLSRFHARDDAQKLASTLSHALRLSGALLLEVEPREISARTVATGADANALCSVHVFDSAAGGSGHTQSLLKDQKGWLDSAIELLKGDSLHRKRCSEACLQCLLDSQSQGDFEAGLLDRKMLLEFLSLNN